MRPILFEIGGLAVESYLFFYALGCLVGGIVFWSEVRRRRWPLETLIFVLLGCMFGAFAGSALFSLLFLDWTALPEHYRFGELLGRTVVGGIAGGFLGVEITKKLIGYPHRTGDAFAVAIPLGHAVGRIGCLLGGCCFGTPSNLPWAITYPAGSVPHAFHVHWGLLDASSLASLPVHPAPLYEIGFDLLLFAILWRMRNHFAERGMLFRLYLALYAGYRFLAEFIRGDSLLPEIGLKPVQYLLLTAAVYYGWIVWRQRNARQRDPA